MKNEILEQFEEKFYFRTSHFFWHAVTAIAGLALAIGVLIFLWGLTPSLKPSVKKEAYPETIAVAADEIVPMLTPPPSRTSVAATTPAAVTAPANGDVVPAAAAIDSTELAYNNSIDSLKTLLPPNRFPWTSRGHWQQDWYRNRRWVVDVWGIQDRLNATFKKVGAESFAQKQALVETYGALVARFPVEHRFTVLRQALDYTKEDLSSAMHNANLLLGACDRYATDKPDIIETLVNFGKRNPRDGQRFIEYSNEIIAEFDSSMRKPMLDELIKCYYAYFDDIQRQEQATAMFLGMRTQFEPDKQPEALNHFYQLYLQKNAAREQEIARIDNQYARAVSDAEVVLAQKQAKKSGYRALGFKIFGGGVIFIAFVAMFLVLLSIQRNIRQLREAAQSSAGK